MTLGSVFFWSSHMSHEEEEVVRHGTYLDTYILENSPETLWTLENDNYGCHTALRSWLTGEGGILPVVVAVVVHCDDPFLPAS